MVVPSPGEVILSDEREIRVALVGCGGMVKRYRTAYARLPGSRWVVAIDPNLATLDE